MPNNSSNHSFLHMIAAAPALYKWAGVALLVVLSAGWLSSGSGGGAPRPQTEPMMPSLLSGLANTFPTGSLTVFPPLPKGVVTPAAAPARVPVQAGPLILPAQTPPRAPVAGHAQITLAGAALPPYGVRPAFQSLGRAQVAEPIASFTVDAPKPLAAVAPSAGLIRLRWRAWYQATKTGAHTLVASIAGGDLRSVTVRVDGQQAPVIAGSRAVCSAFDGCPPTATTAAGAAQLATGWHEIEVEAVADVTGTPRPSVTLYVRGPGTDTPVALVPSWPAAARPAPSPCWRPSMAPAGAPSLPPCAQAGTAP
jgi:hypothetical protein